MQQQAYLAASSGIPGIKGKVERADDGSEEGSFAVTRIRLVDTALKGLSADPERRGNHE